MIKKLHYHKQIQGCPIMKELFNVTNALVKLKTLVFLVPEMIPTDALLENFETISSRR